MQHEQLSLFDLFAAPLEDAPQPVQPEARPVPVMIQASAQQDGGYRVYGVAHAEIVLPDWRPSARDVLSLFPASLSYDVAHGLLDRGDVIDLFAHEVDGDGNMLHMVADAHVTVSAAELYAAESF